AGPRVKPGSRHRVSQFSAGRTRPEYSYPASIVINSPDRRIYEKLLWSVFVPPGSCFRAGTEATVHHQRKYSGRADAAGHRPGAGGGEENPACAGLLVQVSEA